MASTQDFRTCFPEFNDASIYTDSMIEFWDSIAAKLIKECVFGSLVSQMQYLFIAHNIVIQAKHVEESGFGNNPGLNDGAISSKSVDGVSVSLESSATNEIDAGMYNATSYGKQFIRLYRLFGAGCIQL